MMSLCLYTCLQLNCPLGNDVIKILSSLMNATNTAVAYVGFIAKIKQEKVKQLEDDYVHFISLSLFFLFAKFYA